MDVDERVNTFIGALLVIVLLGGLLWGGIYLVALLFDANGGIAGWFCLVGFFLALLAIYNGVRYVTKRWFSKSGTGSAEASYLPLSNATQDGLAHNGQTQDMPPTYASPTARDSQAGKVAPPTVSTAKMEMV